MKPILFDQYETDFTGQGRGVLSACLSCTVEEKLNGSYELTMKYPEDGIHYEEIALRYIVVASSDYATDRQPFRIYQISKPINGVVTVNARHLSYDLSGYPVKPFKANTLAAALKGFSQNALFKVPFKLTANYSSSGAFEMTVPANVRTMFGGTDGSIIDVYGGEWYYDNWQCVLMRRRGADNGVRIAYGKNLASIEQKQNNTSQYTHVMAYWSGTVDERDVLVQGDAIASGNFEFVKTLILDASSDFENQPTKAQLNTRAKAYINANKVFNGATTIKLKFEELQDVKERVALGDTVHIVYQGEVIDARIITAKWNALLERFDSLEVGDAQVTFTDTINKRINSQIKGALAPVETAALKAQATAAQAQTAANSVQGIATEAKSTAQTAQSTADSVQAIATEARTTAQTAQSTAETAQTTAEGANTAVGELDSSLNQTEVLSRLTNAGTDDAIYIQDGKLVINGDRISVNNLMAIVAKIGGFNISNTALYNGLSSFLGSTNGVYLGTDGIAIRKVGTGANWLTFNLSSGILSTNKINASEVELSEGGTLYIGEEGATGNSFLRLNHVSVNAPHLQVTADSSSDINMNGGNIIMGGGTIRDTETGLKYIPAPTTLNLVNCRLQGALYSSAKGIAFSIPVAGKPKTASLTATRMIIRSAGTTQTIISSSTAITPTSTGAIMEGFCSFQYDSSTRFNSAFGNYECVTILLTGTLNLTY